MHAAGLQLQEELPAVVLPCGGKSRTASCLHAVQVQHCWCTINTYQKQRRRYVPVQLAAVKGCPKDLLRPEQLANLRALTCYGLGAILQHLSTWESFPESFQVMLLEYVTMTV